MLNTSFSYNTPRSSTAVQHSIVQSSAGDVSYNISKIDTFPVKDPAARGEE